MLCSNYYYCIRYVIVSITLFFFKQKTAYELRISDWSSDVCSSDLRANFILATHAGNLVGWVGRMRGLHMVSDRAERFYQPRIGQASNQHATGDRDKRHQNQQQLSCEIDPAQYGTVLICRR